MNIHGTNIRGDLDIGCHIRQTFRRNSSKRSVSLRNNSSKRWYKMLGSLRRISSKRLPFIMTGALYQLFEEIPRNDHVLAADWLSQLTWIFMEVTFEEIWTDASRASYFCGCNGRFGLPTRPRLGGQEMSVRDVAVVIQKQVKTLDVKCLFLSRYCFQKGATFVWRFWLIVKHWIFLNRQKLNVVFFFISIS